MIKAPIKLTHDDFITIYMTPVPDFCMAIENIKSVETNIGNSKFKISNFEHSKQHHIPISHWSVTS